MMYLHKTLHGMAPEYVGPNFVFHDNWNSYHLRNSYCLRNTENKQLINKFTLVFPSQHFKKKKKVHQTNYCCYN